MCVCVSKEVRGEAKAFRSEGRLKNCPHIGEHLVAGSAMLGVSYTFCWTAGCRGVNCPMSDPKKGLDFVGLLSSRDPLMRTGGSSMQAACSTLRILSGVPRVGVRMHNERSSVNTGPGREMQ